MKLLIWYDFKDYEKKIGLAIVCSMMQNHSHQKHLNWLKVLLHRQEI